MLRERGGVVVNRGGGKEGCVRVIRGQGVREGDWRMIGVGRVGG